MPMYNALIIYHVLKLENGFYNDDLYIYNSANVQLFGVLAIIIVSTLLAMILECCSIVL